MTRRLDLTEPGAENGDLTASVSSCFRVSRPASSFRDVDDGPGEGGGERGTESGSELARLANSDGL